MATLTNCTGVQVDAQDIVYDRALVGGGFAASVVYSLPDRGSFHQDVVFVGFNPTFNPTNWGFAESSTNSLQIQIITEFYNSPQPLMVTNPVYIEQDPAVRASMALPNFSGNWLNLSPVVPGYVNDYPGEAVSLENCLAASVLGNNMVAAGRGVAFSTNCTALLLINNDFGGATYGGIGTVDNVGTLGTAQIFSNVLGEGVTFHVQLPYTNSFGWFVGSNTYVNSTSTNCPLFADPASSAIHIYQ